MDSISKWYLNKDKLSHISDKTSAAEVMLETVLKWKYRWNICDVLWSKYHTNQLLYSVPLFLACAPFEISATALHDQLSAAANVAVNAEGRYSEVDGLLLLQTFWAGIHSRHPKMWSQAQKDIFFILRLLYDAFFCFFLSANLPVYLKHLEHAADSKLFLN